MKGKDPHEAFSSLAVRYLSGELSPEEARHFRELIEKEPDKKKRFEEFRKIWDSAGSLREQEEYDLDAEWSLMRGKLPGTPGRSMFFYTYRIAAVLVVGLIIAFAWIYGSRLADTEKIVAGTETVEVILSDGTLVTVNRDSKIMYRRTFSDEERKVYLEGEAYFEVTEDPGRPFRIHAGNALVEVLGTSFNVNAYRENPVVEIAVESGVVALSPRKDRQEQIVLRAGNSGTLNRDSRELKLNTRTDPNFVAWKTRELYFDSTPLQEVVDLVNRVYNTRLVIMNDELATCPITVTFRQQSLDAILKVLVETLDLEITREGDQIRLHGEGCAQ